LHGWPIAGDVREPLFFHVEPRCSKSGELKGSGSSGGGGGGSGGGGGGGGGGSGGGRASSGSSKRGLSRSIDAADAETVLASHAQQYQWFWNLNCALRGT
jgi:hypothetical protein